MGDIENVGLIFCVDGCDIYCVVVKYIWIVLIFL